MGVFVKFRNLTIYILLVSATTAVSQPIVDENIWASGGPEGANGGPTEECEISILREQFFELTPPDMTGSGVSLGMTVDNDGLYSQSILFRCGPAESNRNCGTTNIIFPKGINIIGVAGDRDGDGIAELDATDQTWGLTPEVIYDLNSRDMDGSEGPTFEDLDSGGTAMRFKCQHNSPPWGDEFRLLIDYGSDFSTPFSFFVEDTGAADINIGDTDGRDSSNGLVLLTPGCGNSIIEDTEACDDGNQDSGDGCDSLCQYEDQDFDGIPDIFEDQDQDGLVDENETDPADPDTDEDGVCDGPATVEGTCIAGEDLNGNGLLDEGESDPRDRCSPSDQVQACDADLDGVPDGLDCAPEDETLAIEDPCGVCGGDGSTCGATDSDNDGVFDTDDCAPMDPTIARLDACGVCGGDGSTCTAMDTDNDGTNDDDDCAPTDPNRAITDVCGVCGGDGSNCNTDEPTPNLCGSNAECNTANGETCVNGACVVGSVCQADTDCAAGETCANGQCLRVEAAELVVLGGGFVNCQNTRAEAMLWSVLLFGFSRRRKE